MKRYIAILILAVVVMTLSIGCYMDGNRAYPNNPNFRTDDGFNDGYVYPNGAGYVYPDDPNYRNQPGYARPDSILPPISPNAAADPNARTVLPVPTDGAQTTPRVNTSGING